MRAYLIFLSTLLLLLVACAEEKQPSATQQAPAPVETNPPATAVPPTEEPVKAEIQESDATPTQPQKETTEQAEVTPSITVEETNKGGLELAKSSGCLACHAVDKKVVGPAWNDVAKRYAGDINAKAKLIEKVAKGGRGNWTEVVGNMAMPPYSPRVSADNIEALVEFILALNTE